MIPFTVFSDEESTWLTLQELLKLLFFLIFRSRKYLYFNDSRKVVHFNNVIRKWIMKWVTNAIAFCSSCILCHLSGPSTGRKPRRSTTQLAEEIIYSFKKIFFSAFLRTRIRWRFYVYFHNVFGQIFKFVVKMISKNCGSGEFRESWNVMN